MGKYKVVLLDADMTLLDFRRSEREALSKVLAAYGLPHDVGVLSAYSEINDGLWKAMARGETTQSALVVERFARLVKLLGSHEDPKVLNREYEQGLGREGHLLPGAMEFCQRLRDGGLELAIATNGLPAAQWGRYRGTGLDKVVPHLLVSVELGAQKPQKEFFDRALEALGVADRSTVVMVGDGLETDILGADRAGIDTVWYDPEGRPLTGPAVPTYTASSYDEICALLLE